MIEILRKNSKKGLLEFIVIIPLLKESAIYFIADTNSVFECSI